MWPTVARHLSSRRHRSVEERVKFGLIGQLPTVWHPSFDLPWQQWSLVNHCTGSLRCLPAEMATGRLWPVKSRKRCFTLSMLVHWLVACPSCTLQMMMLLHGWPTVVVHRGCTRRQQHPFFIHPWTPDRRGVGTFMPAVRHRYLGDDDGHTNNN